MNDGLRTGGLSRATLVIVLSLAAAVPGHTGPRDWRSGRGVAHVPCNGRRPYGTVTDCWAVSTPEPHAFTASTERM
jgi:hypothetical protein